MAVNDAAAAAGDLNCVPARLNFEPRNRIDVLGKAWGPLFFEVGGMMTVNGHFAPGCPRLRAAINAWCVCVCMCIIYGSA